MFNYFHMSYSKIYTAIKSNLEPEKTENIPLHTIAKVEKSKLSYQAF